MSTKGKFVEILEFDAGNEETNFGRKKEIFNKIKVSVVMELV